MPIEATKIEKVRDNLYMITGSTPMPRETFSGGNTGVFVTGNGVIVVDTKLGGWGQVILDHYTKERYRAAVQAIYDELKSQAR